MDIDQYKHAVIAHFKSGQATDAEWAELAQAILHASENEWEAVPQIDVAIYGLCQECDDTAYVCTDTYCVHRHQN